MKQHLLFSLLCLPLFLFSQTQPDPCLRSTAFHIVVLGSSTAAGAGAGHPDSTWVGRYRNYLQSINPANQVTNLAVGGFVTYRIMPDNFIPPASRPLPDTNRNITEALSRNPDAIIVNLPSNDRQFPMQEQLDNFDSLYRHANSHGVPMWICTTQPINAGPTTVAFQMAVRDSILLTYGTQAIDFWTGIADTATGTIDTTYNADGIHLNARGHRLLFEKVVAKNIPGAIYTPAPGADIGITDLIIDPSNVCGDSLTEVQLAINNFGSPVANSFPVRLDYQELSGGQNGFQTANAPAGLGTCEADTFSFFLNLHNGGNFLFTASHQAAGDSNPTNDSLQRTRAFTGHPSVSALPDTGCVNTSLQLSAAAGAGDTLFWYDMPSGGSAVGSGRSFSTPVLAQNTTFYVEAIRGNLFYDNSLLTTRQSNVNWNGNMFNLVAKDTLTMDSLALKVADMGQQGVEVYYKSGSYRGFETNANAWTFLGQDTVNAVDPDSLVVARIGGLVLMPGDTMGIYVQMQNSSTRLSYLSNGSSNVFSSSELDLVTGSGISHNFSNSFYPRNWNGRIYYHYGFRPDGDCKSERVPVEAIVTGPPTVDLGPDTTACQQWVLMPGNSPYNRYLWSTGDTSAQLSVTQSGVYWVEVNNSCGREIDAVGVTIEEPPVADFTASPAGITGTDVNLSNLSMHAAYLIWDMGDGNSFTGNLPYYHFQQAGTYQIRLIAGNSCGEDTFFQSVMFTTGIGDLKAKLSLDLYPNPVRNTASLKHPERFPRDFQLQWLNATGKKIAVPFHSADNNLLQFDLTGFPAGLYFLHYRDKAGVFGRSIILER